MRVVNVFVLIPVALVAAFAFSGCAGMLRADAGDVEATGAASPGPALVGTWKGQASQPEYPGPARTAVELTIRPDGTWQWGKGNDDVRARGIVRRATRDEVVLETQEAKDAAAQRIQLQRTGDTLWGLSEAFIPGRPASVKLDKDS